MLNYIWLALIVLAMVLGACGGTLDAVTKGAFTAAEDAVMKIALPLVGVMAIWLGMMRLAEKAGLIQRLARVLRPVMTRLFPDVPAEHPAMGAMVLNMGANILGLSNAATPLGLKAMSHLESLNRLPGTASNAMCTFLTINTSSIQLLPVTAITVLAVNHGTHPTAIVSSALLATMIATGVGIVAVKLLEKLPAYRLSAAPPVDVPNTVEQTENEKPEELPRMNGWWTAAIYGLLGITAALFLITLLPGFFGQWPFLVKALPGILGQKPPVTAEPFFLRFLNTLSLFAVPFMLAILPLYAAARGVKVYEEFVEGAKDGFQTALRIIPYLVGMLVAIKMFRDAGGVQMITDALKPVLGRIQYPPELLPLALMRSLSGSGSLAVFTDLVKEFGPDSLIALTAATIYGSSETTFYVIAVYFGSVNVHRTRHAIPAGLIADAAGVFASVFICRAMFA
ncbi:MAG TPA: nucleoside recognition domain-containing protein [Chthoniobacterales bacterium]